MKTLRQTVTFPATPKELYELYLDPKKHGAVIGAKVTIAARPGTVMSAWDGYCTGTILGLVPGRLILQTWRASEWKESEPDSILALHFEPKGAKTQLTMVHANVPDAHAASLERGWKEHYWVPWMARFLVNVRAPPQEK